ncbi:extracellular solute-binding protein [Bifidobacterium sp. 82T10]|uniref:Extracellular solute-binding protein n=1 Tax=Bifidobacterium miconis TaxID=2834435 RepID=A0ABS6WJY9_9BIFI|nr:extracellular solute-binding protein [Bifidobacterium miconis]MBW3093531.1 extracellular solute-binding protein [Bifidobacterium miconis]
MLTGCGTDTATNADVPVTVMVVQSSDQMSVAKMGWTKQVEKACGCEIKWQSVDAKSFDQQRSTSLASETVPDIAINAFSYDDAQRFPYFEDFNQHLDAMPNVKAYLEQIPTARKLTENENGNLYVLKSYGGKGFAVSAQYLMINKTWLDKLELDMPTTWDEYMNVLEAFKTRDPNGNGKADEIPLSPKKLDTTSFGWANPFLLLNSTGITTHFATGGWSNQGIYVKDGKAGNFMTDNRFKQVISYLHTLMDKGLIPKDALTKDDSKYNAELYADGKTALVGSAFGWGASDFGTGLEDEYVAIPTLKPTADTPDPELVWDMSRDQYAFASSTVMSAKAVNKQTVYKIINSLFSEKLGVQQYRGTIPEWVTDEGNHRYKVADKFWDTGTMGKREATEGGFAGWIPDEVEWEDEINIDRLKKMDAAYQDIYKNIDPTKDVMPVNVRPTSEQITTLSNNNTAIFDYAVNKIATWIANGGIDGEWDEYAKQLKALGIDDNVAIWQEAYDKATKN